MEKRLPSWVVGTEHYFSSLLHLEVLYVLYLAGIGASSVSISLKSALCSLQPLHLHNAGRVNTCWDI